MATGEPPHGDPPKTTLAQVWGVVTRVLRTPATSPQTGFIPPAHLYGIMDMTVVIFPIDFDGVPSASAYKKGYPQHAREATPALGWGWPPRRQARRTPPQGRPSWMTHPQTRGCNPSMPVVGQPCTLPGRSQVHTGDSPALWSLIPPDAIQAIRVQPQVLGGWVNHSART